MALTVEDGAGLANAEAYVSVSDAGTYHTAMGNTGWTGTDAVKEVALRRATQYIDSHYRFRGVALTSTQALAFPRDLGLTWPIRSLSHATCELALRALSGTLHADQDDRAVVSEKIGPIEVGYAAPQFGGQTRYAVVDDLLAPLTAGGARGTMRIERAA